MALVFIAYRCYPNTTAAAGCIAYLDKISCQIIIIWPSYYNKNSNGSNNNSNFIIIIIKFIIQTFFNTQFQYI